MCSGNEKAQITHLVVNPLYWAMSVSNGTGVTVVAFAMLDSTAPTGTDNSETKNPVPTLPDPVLRPARFSADTHSMIPSSVGGWRMIQLCATFHHPVRSSPRW